MLRAANFNSVAHPRRAAAIREREMAMLLRAYGNALTAKQAAEWIGITRLEAEQIAARYGVALRETND